MNITIYLRGSVVYLPTIGRIPHGHSIIGGPVDVVEASDTEELKRAILRTIARGNPAVPRPPRDRDPNDSAMLKAAGVNNWTTFYRGLQIWDLSDDGGIYKITGNKPGKYGGWVPDLNNVVAFSLGTSLDEVIDRVIAIVQQSAKEKSGRKAPTRPAEVIAPPSSSEPPDDPRLTLPKDYVHLAPADRNDELGDFLEWIVNCEPKDAPVIRAEIKRLLYDFGDQRGGDAFSEALRRVLDGWPLDRKSREALLMKYEPFTRLDRDEV